MRRSSFGVSIPNVPAARSLVSGDVASDQFDPGHGMSQRRGADNRIS